MNVKELREILAAYPDDMPLIVERYSDYDDLAMPEIVEGVRKDCYIMRASQFSRLSPTDNAKREQFLLLTFKD